MLIQGKNRKGKAPLENNLSSGVKDKNKYFYKYISTERKTKKNLPFEETQ